MRIGLLQLNSTIGDFTANQARLKDAYQTACDRGAEFVAAPEMCVGGYPPRDLLLCDEFVDANLDALEQITSKSPGSAPLMPIGPLR